MTASIGSLGQLSINVASPGDATEHRLDYKREDLGYTEEFVDANGLRGTRSRSVEKNRGGLQRLDGPIEFEPNSLELTRLLAWALGGVASTTYSLTDALPRAVIIIDRVAKVFTFNGCVCDTITFAANQGEVLKVAVNVVGMTETIANAGTFTSLSLDTTTQPFILADLALVVNGVTVTPKNFALTVNNYIDKERFFNSLTLTATNALDRLVTFSCLLPYGDFTALYGAGGAAGVSMVATFTNGGASLTITCGKITLPRRKPSTPGRVEIMMPLEATVWKSGSTSEIVVSLQPGP